MYPSHPFPRHARSLLISGLTLLIITLFPAVSNAQGGSTLQDWFFGTENIVLPQQRSYRVGNDVAPEGGELRVVGVSAEIEMIDDVAITRLTTEIASPPTLQGGEETTFQLLLPIPQDAEIVEAPKTGVETDSNQVILNLGDDEAISAFLAGARAIDASEVLEFAGQRLILAGPFALSVDATEKVTITYRQNLVVNGKRIDYVLPRSESFAFGNTPWSITARIKTSEPIAALYSPSHSIASERSSPNEALISVESGSGPLSGSHTSVVDNEAQKIDLGDFRLSVLRGKEVEASFMGYVEGQGDRGCLLMLIGANPGVQSQTERVRREVILVIDRSGSMSGGKIEQARKAAQNVLEGLDNGEAFTIIDYADEVESYSPNPVIKNGSSFRSGNDYIKNIEATGGTNIHDALRTAVGMEPTPDFLPIVIFLTDGMPTTGVTAEDSIRRAVIDANVHNRRIFTVGVGYDVNAPLLDAIARESRASTTIVMPGEEVDKSVDLLFRKLNGPVFSDITMETRTLDGADASHLVTDMLPATLHDLYEGDYLSLLGHYVPDRPVLFTLRGIYLGEERTFTFTFDPDRDRIEDAPFLCRLWASRQIMERVDEVTRDGAIPKDERTEEDRERLRQRTEEIIELSTANGIITEYTRHLSQGSREYEEYSILADSIASGAIAVDWVSEEESDEKAGALLYAESKLVDRAQDTRTGASASNQVMNKSSKALKGGKMNKVNSFIDAEMNVVEIKTVQQLADLSFFRRGDRWVDSRILDSAATEAPDATITFGTAAYDDLVRSLVAVNRAEVLGLRGEVLMRDERGRIVLIASQRMPDME